jgi:hypothetical protein
MLRIIICFVVLAFVVYLLERPVVPEPVDRDPSALALAEKIKRCERLYGNESDRKTEFGNCQTNCSNNTNDRIRVCVDACQATADRFGNCANQTTLPK